MARQPLSPADRIRELSAINADVAAMLRSAGEAINSLANSRHSTPSNDGEDTQMGDGGKVATLDEKKETFSERTKAYYTGLQAVTARLKRQAYAMEEAGIIAAEAPVLSQRQAAASSAPQRGQPTTEATRITNGGLGHLDVGWLNSRGNKVSAEKENELVNEAKRLLEETLRQPHESEEPDLA